MTSTKEIKALARHFVEEVNKEKVAAIAVLDELYAKDFVFHSVIGKDIHGLKTYKQFNSEFFDAVAYTNFTIDDLIAEGDKVVMRWTLTGTHTGKLKGDHLASHPKQRKFILRLATMVPLPLSLAIKQGIL